MKRNASVYALLLVALAAVGFAEETSPREKAPPVKIYFMAGQSNMEGHASGQYVEENHPELMIPRDDVYCAYAGKVTGKLQLGFGGRETSYGMELVMGKVLGNALDSPVLFVKSCTGGTTLHRDWRPPSTVKRAGGEIGPLYTRMMRRYHNVVANLDLHYPGAKDRGYEIAGFIWFQGENDCCAKDEGGTGFWEYYERNLEDLLKDIRSDLGVPELPVLIVQINDSCWDGLPNRGGTVLRPIQQKVAEADPDAAWIKTSDLNDGFHYDSASFITIGQRGGKAMLPFARKPVPQKPAEILAGRKRFLARQPKRGSPKTGSLRKGLIGYWKFDEGTGSTTADVSSRDNNGQLKGNPDWCDGLFGKAVYLTGQQRIEMPQFQETLGPSGNIENLSVSYWVRTNRFGDARVGKGKGKPFVPRDESNWFHCETANESGWDVCCFDCDHCAFVTAGFNDGPRSLMSNRQAHLVGDGVEWHHVVMVYRGNSKEFDIYVDGDRSDKRDSSAVIEGTKATGHIIPAKDALLTVGGLIDHDGQFQVFDELAIWDRPLEPEEAKSLFNKGFGAEITTR
ncbi:MAG: hypothetical protein HQ567_04390 [Candidatus Nealsonbacteria bacterium]|nr:hypothetical protein [Candidatus Nealsonbacteria bacterium]